MLLPLTVLLLPRESDVDDGVRKEAEDDGTPFPEYPLVSEEDAPPRMSMSPMSPDGKNSLTEMASLTIGWWWPRPRVPPGRYGSVAGVVDAEDTTAAEAAPGMSSADAFGGLSMCGSNWANE